MKKYFFHYSDRYRSGSFDIRKVYRWQSTGKAYFKRYIITFEDQTSVTLDPDEFYQFEKQFNALEE